MKKTIILFLCLIFCFACTACDMAYLRVEGMLKSETPEMYIDTTPDGKYGYDGKIIKEDGTELKILVFFSHGLFEIFKEKEYNEYGQHNSESLLCRGRYKQKGNTTLILIFENGERVTLKKIEE